MTCNTADLFLYITFSDSLHRTAVSKVFVIEYVCVPSADADSLVLSIDSTVILFTAIPP